MMWSLWKEIGIKNLNGKKVLTRYDQKLVKSYLTFYIKYAVEIDDIFEIKCNKLFVSIRKKNTNT